MFAVGLEAFKDREPLAFDAEFKLKKTLTQDVVSQRGEVSKEKPAPLPPSGRMLFLLVFYRAKKIAAEALSGILIRRAQALVSECATIAKPVRENVKLAQRNSPSILH